ncbi:hypothetical protein FPY71_07080 [Aureimonas fodinaquatilis]|uniref:Uncharacterized protein n=1 Tax=Aureimonas fodinaquatilis TaxID=2565783 RepID=A0A5B0DWA5_9HYPH|nr:hypothetical protein [Aureimonas fodinaquatilis]KAA0970282.1 hypothetical protein FPY71_07080 [Aureimonas fodinaquatilis]
MTTRVITNEIQRDALTALIASRPLPFTAEVVKGKRRSVEQNRLQRRLLNEIAAQTDQTHEEVRALCKLTIGVPILRAGSELFAEKYDRLIKPMPYERKLEMMAEPIDFPVTRLMNTAQKTAYIEGIYRVFSEQGVIFSEDQERAR